MATPTIPNGEEYFFPVIYEGNGAGQRVGKFVPFTDNGTIDNSCIFNDDDDAYLARTFSTPTNNKKWTYSVWIKRGNLGTNQAIMSADYDGASYWDMRFNTSNQIYIQNRIGSSNILLANTTRTFEDTSKWYHLVFVYDSDNSTSTSRAILYIDGDIQTLSAYPSSGDASAYNVNSEPHHIGVSRTADASGAIWSEFDGYFAEANFIDGQALTPSTFGLTDTSTGRWIPKTLSGITYGTNGFRLKFQDSSALGDDTSGNTNDFTATNLASTDQTTDSPTQLFNTMGGSFSAGVTLAEGNLKVTTPSSGSGYNQCVGQPAFGVRSGKWYWEVKVNVKGQNAYGWKSDDNTAGSQASATGNYKQGPAYNVGSSGGFSDGEWDCNYSTGASEFSPFTTASVDDVIMFALDLDNRKGYVGLNGTWFNSANPANGTGSIGLGRDPVPSANARFYPMCLRLDSSGTGTYNFGATSFAHTPPTGFVALGQDNLPEATKGISGLVWTKNRDATDNHQLYDSSRGKQKDLHSNTTDAESTTTDGLQKFLKGGQQIEDDVSINTAGESFVTWNWVANGGTTASNGDGSITSTVQANTTAGFSIVEFVGTGSAATVGHGLGQAPEFIIVKNLTDSSNWLIYSSLFGANKYGYLNLTNAWATDTTGFNNVEPTSSVFSVGTANETNGSTDSLVAYCWHGVDGYSKFGSYTGNGSTDGPFIYTGFRPAWIMWKRTNSTNQWVIHDSTRNPFNPTNQILYANLTQADGTGDAIVTDLLSNGFKLRSGTNGNANTSGSTYIYMAFAEHPFVGDGTNPVTAR